MGYFIACFSQQIQAGEATEDRGLCLCSLSLSLALSHSLSHVCTCSLTSHLQIDECLNLKVLSHLLAPEHHLLPRAVPLELLSWRTAFLAAFTSELVTKRELCVSTVKYIWNANLHPWLRAAGWSTVCCSWLSPGQRRGQRPEHFGHSVDELPGL